MNQTVIRPPRLHAGDRIVVVSPSSTIADRLAQADIAQQRISEALGLQLEFAAHARGQHFYSSGTAIERRDDLLAAFQDPTVHGVFFSTGGATAIDLVDQLDYAAITENPKIVAGLSDSSTLLNAITAQTGLVTFHGFEMYDFAAHEMGYTSNSMRDVLFDSWAGAYTPNTNWRELEQEPTTYEKWREIKPGRAQGPAYGGNSDAVMQLLGTKYAPPLDGTILFLETYGLQKRHIQALMVELKLRGVLDTIAGLILGYCLGSDAPGTGNDRDVADIVTEVTQGYDFPVMQIGEIGHHVENLILPIGAEVDLDTSSLSFRLVTPAVS